jgi:hypothetical protein
MNAATAQLARIEAGRMLRHPAPWAGVALSVLMGWSMWDESWSGQRYTGLVASMTPLLLGISLASVSAFGRELVPVADDAPLDPARRSLARLLGGLPLVVLAAVLVAGVAVWLRATGGISLGDEPGRTMQAHHTLPELFQLVLLACLAVVAGAAVVHVLRQRLAASIVLAIGWFLVGATYWIFNGPVSRWFALVQVQPVHIELGPPTTDPTTFPAMWLLSAPGEFQDHWARVVVSPALALGHDLYLVGLVALGAAAAVPGRLRRVLGILGALVAAAALAVQWAVAP